VSVRKLAVFGLVLLFVGCAQERTGPVYQEPETVPALPEEVVEAAPAGPVKIALLLPLSGSAETVGRDMLEAAQIALFDVGQTDMVLLPRDTGGTAQGAAAAARAVLEEGADLIIGPLFSESVRPVGQAAAAEGVNVIAFTTDASVAGGNVLVMGFVPADQVDRVVGYGVSRGLNGYALLAPGSPYGQTVGDALREATARHGAELVAAELYQSGGREFSAPVERLAQQADAIDAIMLPDAGLRLRTIAPLLPYYNMDTEQVMGTGLWDGQNVGIEPALIGAWFAAPDPDLRAEFVADYRANFGQAPPRLATLAYDAVSLAAFLAQGRDGEPYTLANLTDPSGFIGADGIFRFGPEGVAERGLAVLEVTADGARVIDPAPVSFAVAGF